MRHVESLGGWRWLAVGAVVLALVRIIASYSVFSHTVEESTHLAAGLERWSVGSYTLDRLQPPLARVVLALPPFLNGARIVNEAQSQAVSDVMRSGRSYESNLWLARSGVLPFFLLACWFVWWWGARIGGAPAGAFSVVLFSLAPPVVAHAGLATTDMPLVATLLGASAAWLVWAEHPRSLWRSAVLGAAVGVAFATRFSAIGYFGAIALMSLFFLRPWRAAHTGELARSAGVAALAAFALLWVSHGLSVGSVGGVFTPFPEFFSGLGEVLRDGGARHIGYLLGSVSSSGQVAFYPVVLLVKTPLALLLLSGFGAVWAVQQWRRSGKRDHGALLPLLMAGAVLVLAIAANISAGVRHVLPIYAFVAVVAGAFLARAWVYRGTLRILTAVILGVYLIESASAHPDALAYFNIIVPNEPGRVLVDSDLDWGQDLHRLRDTTRARGITHLALAYYGSGDHARDVLPALRPVSQHAADTGWVAISETYYRAGAISHVGGRLSIDTTAYKWLREQELVTRVGKSIRLYRVPATVLRP